jgi:hypothetical protein
MALADFRWLGWVLMLGVSASLLLGCGEEPEAAERTDAAVSDEMTPEQEAAGLIEMMQRPAAPPEMKVMTIEILAAYDPALTVDPMVEMLRVEEEPMVLIAVIRNLPPAAEDPATPELKLLSEQHPEADVREAARLRLDEFAAFHD